MSKITVAFIKAAMVYFVLAMLLGIHMARTGAVYPSMPVHVHFNLLGWISMMIYGVAYHILPRFSGQPLWSEKLSVWHFWLANIGLIGMVLGWIIIGQPGGGAVLYIFSIVEGVSVILFALNMFNTVKAAPATPPRPPLRPRPTPPAAKPPTPATPKPKAEAETKAVEKTASTTTAKAKKKPVTTKKKAKPTAKKVKNEENKKEVPKEALPLSTPTTTIELADTKKGEDKKEIETKEAEKDTSSASAANEAREEKESPEKPADEVDTKPEPEAGETGEKTGSE